MTHHYGSHWGWGGRGFGLGGCPVCGGGGFHFHPPRRFPSEKEFIEMLETYKKELEEELEGINKEIEELKKKAG